MVSAVSDEGYLTMRRFNPHMLGLARDARGLTQPELAALIGIGQGTLSKYETGVNTPPEEFVSAAARVLTYPPHFSLSLIGRSAC